MQWIDGSDIDIHQYTGETICEKLSLEMWGCCKMEQWSSWADFIQVAYFIIAFDTELNMEGIFTFLENSIGHYAPQIIQAFRAISDDNDADILEEICALCPPDIMRGEFLENGHQEYEINCFDDDHELKEELPFGNCVPVKNETTNMCYENQKFIFCKIFKSKCSNVNFIKTK